MQPWLPEAKQRYLRRQDNASDGSLTKEILYQLAQGKRCAYCGTTKSISIDHIIPLVKGGAHTITNIQILCLSCNSKKCDKLPEFVSPNRTILQSATVPDISETVFLLPILSNSSANEDSRNVWSRYW